MKQSDKILDLLLKGANQGLSASETSFLKETLNVAEIEDFVEVINSYLLEQNNLEPDLTIKSNLMNQFQATQQKPEKLGGFKPLFIKLSVAAILILGLSAALIYLIPTTENSTAIEDSNDLKEMEFMDFEGNETVKIEDEEEMKEETKYLLHVDFFSNSSLIGK